VGYTLYVGTPAAEADFAQYRQVRDEARRLGMPLIVWASPRGAAIEAKGGKDSFYAVDQREHRESLAFVTQLQEILAKYGDVRL
jgi:DhnA family fructose-bisphosphate aldolase class Ia